MIHHYKFRDRHCILLDGIYRRNKKNEEENGLKKACIHTTQIAASKQQKVKESMYIVRVWWEKVKKNLGPLVLTVPQVTRVENKSDNTAFQWSKNLNTRTHAQKQPCIHDHMGEVLSEFKPCMHPPVFRI